MELRRSLAVFLLLLCGAYSAAYAVQPDEVLDNPALEHEAREISAGLRCLVCQNQSIDDSDAPLARDLRILVRERLKSGDTPQQVVDFVVARYGEFILLRPRFSAKTLLLWLAPLLLLGAGGYLAFRIFHRKDEKAAIPPAPLSDDERKRLEGILSERPS
jgi:cytochrome c-type biogenesis protein CcmH